MEPQARVRTAVQPAEKPHVPTSVVLEELIRDAPAGQVTLAWLMEHLRTRSFGIILLLLGVCGLLPIASPVAGVMAALAGFQMILAHPAPIFPRRVAEQAVSTDKLVAMLMRVIPWLRYLERFIRPRWPTPFETTKRVTGVFVLLLGLCLLIPVPLSNIPISVIIVWVAFAYLEEDGLLLAAAMTVALGLFGVGAAAMWSTVATMIWLTR